MCSESQIVAIVYEQNIETVVWGDSMIVAPRNTADNVWQGYQMEKMDDQFNSPWWCNDMETLSLLLGLYEGNPLVSGGFTASQNTISEEPLTAVSQKKHWSLQWLDTMTSHCYAKSYDLSAIMNKKIFLRATNLVGFTIKRWHKTDYI